MVEVVKGCTVQLECEVTGTAPFEVTWFKNKNPVSSDKKYSIVSKETVAYLEIKSFESADVGDYQCCISNDVGKITTKAVAKLKGWYNPFQWSKLFFFFSLVILFNVKMNIHFFMQSHHRL